MGLFFAHGSDTFEEAEHLINSNISCDTLTEDQLVIIGDYLMEQIHPGEEHTMMDGMMGGEGSESLRQGHLRMACGVIVMLLNLFQFPECFADPRSLACVVVLRFQQDIFF